MPLPAVAYVEHDHFVAVVRADRSGVAYLCSDCGPWPGGRVDLTWKQWHALTPSAYAVVTRQDSASDRWLRLVLAATPSKALAAGTALKGRKAHKTVRLADLARIVPTPEELALHLVALRAGAGSNSVCGFPNSSLQCACFVCCPKDCGGPGGDMTGALGGDPVNLATGEEEYTPPSDLTVYNPIGPSVTWRRTYTSLRGYDPFYEYDDMGMGWTHPYNVGVLDPTAGANPQVVAGTTENLTPNGHDAPGASLTWDVIPGGPDGGNLQHPRRLERHVQRRSQYHGDHGSHQRLRRDGL